MNFNEIIVEYADGSIDTFCDENLDFVIQYLEAQDTFNEVERIIIDPR